VQAVNGIDLDIERGEVTAIIGENGAGKSTLMKILAGAVRPDAGTYRLRGEAVTFHSVRDAGRRGVAIVFQELSLYPHLDVLANLYVPDLPRTSWGWFDRRAATKKAEPILRRIGLDVPLQLPVGELTLGDRQLVEIARGLLADASVLILDEPNSALNSVETDRLLDVVRSLRDEGTAVLFISHRLEEVRAISDRVVVMRNGEIVRDTTPQRTSIGELVADMVGHELNGVRRPTQRVRAGGASSPVLRVVDLAVGEQLRHATFEVFRGEVVGLAGLAGAGPEAVLSVLFGRARPTAGHVAMPDGGPAPKSMQAAVGRSIAFVPSDRRKDGLALARSVADNITQVRAVALGRMGFVIRKADVAGRAQARVNELSIKVGSLGSPVGALSGGNQQKVVLAKWLEAEPTLILLDDPTRGVDVGAKAEIYSLVDQLAAAGMTVLFRSSELAEYEAVCDRVLIFHRGRQASQLDGEALSELNILAGINNAAEPVPI
jgi:ABC-type sugar transport system ATPase subunit